jgi:hypothetical protein
MNDDDDDDDEVDDDDDDGDGEDGLAGTARIIVVSTSSLLSSKINAMLPMVICT